MGFDWTAPQKITRVSGALSTFGSLWIIVCSLRQRHEKLKRSSGRLIFMLSVYDCMSSFWYFMGNWAQPPTEFSEMGQNKGTVASCEASGFFIQLGTITIPAYNVALAVQYLLIVRFRMSDARIWVCLERYVHVAIGLLGLALAIVPLPLDLYNPWFGYCYISVNGYVSEGVFERGTTSVSNALKVFSMTWVIACGFVVTAAMIWIYVAARTTMQRSIVRASSLYEATSNSSSKTMATIRAAFSISRSFRGGANSTGANTSSNGNSDRARMGSRINRVARMALLYTFPYYITWGIPSCLILINTIWHPWGASYTLRAPRKVRNVYIEQVYLATAMPIQGFINWVVFVMPTIRDYSLFKTIFCKRCRCPNGRTKESAGASPVTVGEDIIKTREEEEEEDCPTKKETFGTSLVVTGGEEEDDGFVSPQQKEPAGTSLVTSVVVTGEEDTEPPQEEESA